MRGNNNFPFTQNDVIVNNYLNIPNRYVSDVMVLNEIIEQAGRQSRASEQNGMLLDTKSLVTINSYKLIYCCLVPSLLSMSVFVSLMC